MNIKEINYKRKKLRGVVHTTLNPEGPGCVRIHLVPPKFSLRAEPYIVILNGQDIIPINLSWAILLSNFIEEVNEFKEEEISSDDLVSVVDRAVSKTQKVYFNVPPIELKQDLWKIYSTLCDVAYGRKLKTKIGYMTLGEYAPKMKAPHRMDLMVSSMATPDGKWNCNQKCLHCYACGQKQAEVQELKTDEWKQIIDKCRNVGIPQLTFTGGEPTMRKDLVELIKYSEWFVTRLNTNGVLLTESLCKSLYDASLDSVQITLYSYNSEVHNKLVGANNYERTVQGIKNAVKAGLNVSINTPICSLNSDYVETLKFINSLGVSYVSCSGLIVTGNATKQESKDTQLDTDVLYYILRQAADYCKKKHMEISFTSPGWISEKRLRFLKLTVPSCGACLSNMAISPDGKVIPCQSWLGGDVLGDMLKDKWSKIWNNPNCINNRNYSAEMAQRCPLREMEEK